MLRQTRATYLQRMRKWLNSGVVRYLLPFLAVALAVAAQAVVASMLPKHHDFPYAFFYLIAVFATAWYGGYVPGAIACLITMVILPLAAVPGFRLANVDPSRLVLFLGVSLGVSRVAQAQRERREVLREANDELDKRVQAKTQDLTQAIAALESEIGQHRSTEKKLHAQLERLNLLDQITRSIAERQDVRSIFQVVIRSLEDHLPVDFGCVCLYDSAAETLTVTCVGVHSEALAMELAMTQQARIEIDQNGLSRALRGQLVYEQDVSQVQFPFPRRLSEGGLRSLVVAPLLLESQVFGILIGARRLPGSFSSTDCEFVRQLSEHVALAIHQAQIYAALQQAYDDLRQSQQAVMQQERLRALGQMASGIAHDINNAISPVALYTEWLLEREPGLTARTRSYLETTQRAIEDVAHTVARMREFYRQRKPQLTLEPVHINGLIQQVVDLTRARWSDIPQQRGVMIQLRTDLAQDLPAIAGIESEIREALINLIFNAVDAMPEGGVLTVRTRAAPLSSQSAEPHVSVDVEDTGIGMDEETRRHCLEPFFTTKGERGTGLGLAMVYGMAQRHSAEVALESELGKGATVSLRFPVPSAVRSLNKLAAAIATPSRQRILVVDDDPLLIKSLRDTLEADGHVVVTASGGQEGIDTFKRAVAGPEPFTAVMTDLGMPYVDGRKVASAIKTASPFTPVIMLTGWGQRLAAEGDMPPHVDRLLSKPPRLNQVRAALAEVAGGLVGAETSAR